MSDDHGYIIWTFGQKGEPEMRKFSRYPPNVTDHWKSRMLCAPIPMREGEIDKSIDELKKLYPAPENELPTAD